MSRHLLALLSALVMLAVAAPPAPAAEGDVSQRIVGGSNADIADWPYLVAIREEGSAFCGGSLIEPNLVLTAAHCLVDDFGNELDPSNWDVVLGRTDLTDDTSGDTVAIADTFPHSDYDPSSSENDVGVIELAVSLSGAETVELDTSNGNPFWGPGDTAYVAGWGLLEEGGADSETQLQQTSLPILSDDDCEDPAVYGSGFYGDSMICAGVTDGSTDSCQGDSGGPLVVNEGAGDVQIGVVSWGNGCARAGFPGVYAWLEGCRIDNWLGAARQVLAGTPRPAARTCPTSGGGSSGGGSTLAPGPSGAATNTGATSAKCRSAKRKLRKAKRRYRKAKKAYRRNRSARNRKRLRKSKRAYKRAKKSARRACR